MDNLKGMTDEELALSYVGGNNKAFDLLLSRTQSKLFSYSWFTTTIGLMMSSRRHLSR